MAGAEPLTVSVSFRPLADADAAWIDAWLPAVAATVGAGAADFASLRAKGRSALVVRRDGTDVGVVAYALDRPRRGAATAELIATPPDNARKGSGMAAAALLESALRDAGMRTVYAPSPERHGIAMYFWIRLGYRPLLRGDWPWARDGVAWLARDIAQTNGKMARTASRKLSP